MYFAIDVESDGPIPGDYSMVSFGAVIVEPMLTRTFYAKLRPISTMWDPEALAVSKHTREETLLFGHPEAEMKRFVAWVKENSATRPQFISDNNAYDWSFINWYCIHYLGLDGNPFGHTSRNLNDLFKGMTLNMQSNYMHLRKTKLTHHPVDDAKGFAEALLQMQTMGLLIDLS